MAIPAFDGILNILPPHQGDPRNPAELSPFPCTIYEIVDRFGFSPQRKTILEGFLDLRLKLLALGLKAVQWIDGSFLEDIESQESRPPGDIDVVTFALSTLALADLHQLISASDPFLLSPKHVKSTFKVDHFLIPLASDPWQLVEHSTYFYGLFSHRRDRMWKGMLKVGMLDIAEDQAALAHLRSLP